ncbi:MAG: hypothetical protein ACK4TF_06270 [Thermodesulfovibrionales bacterium]
MGLSKWMIKEGYDIKEIKEGVIKWLKFTNPSGYTGDGCYIGNCEKSFAKNGCGGMKPDIIRW